MKTDTNPFIVHRISSIKLAALLWNDHKLQVADAINEFPHLHEGRTYLRWNDGFGKIRSVDLVTELLNGDDERECYVSTSVTNACEN